MRKRLLLGVAMGVVLACSHTTGPTAGVLKVDLTTPNSGGDGAILLTVTGPTALTSASAAAGLRLFTVVPLGPTSNFVLTGTLSSGTILTVGVTDVGQVSAYKASIRQVATPTFQPRTLTNYSLKVSP